MMPSSLVNAKKDTPMLLRTLASLYLQMRYQLAEAYEPTIGARIKERITGLSKLMHEDFSWDNEQAIRNRAPEEVHKDT